MTELGGDSCKFAGKGAEASPPDELSLQRERPGSARRPINLISLLFARGIGART